MNWLFALIFNFIFILCVNAQDKTLLFSEVVSTTPEKKEITVTHDNQAPWEVNDRVCVLRDQKDIACGVVISKTKELATVKVTSQISEVSKDALADSSGEYLQLSFELPFPEKGDALRLVDRDPKSSIRKISSELKSQKEFGGEKIKTDIYDHLKVEEPFEPKNLITGGVNLLFPNIEFQQSISKKSALGIMPIYINYSVSKGSIKGPGIFFNYNYYSGEAFSGYWLKSGLGLYGLTYALNGQEDNRVSPALSLSIGRRVFKNKNFNFGFGAGGQYIFSNTNTGLAFSGFIPSLILDVGFSF